MKTSTVMILSLLALDSFLTTQLNAAEWRLNSVPPVTLAQLLVNRETLGLHVNYRSHRWPTSHASLNETGLGDSHTLKPPIHSFIVSEHVRFIGNIKLGNNASFFIGIKMKFE